MKLHLLPRGNWDCSYKIDLGDGEGYLRVYDSETYTSVHHLWTYGFWEWDTEVL